MSPGSSVPGGYLSEIFCSYQGEGARVGQRHLFVRLAGCNIRCTYCDTPDSLIKTRRLRVSYPDGREQVSENPLSPRALAGLVTEFCRLDPSIAMLAITGGEPLLQAPFLGAWLSEFPPPVACLLETNALLAEAFTVVAAMVEVVSADLKLPSNSGEPDTWERQRAFLRACSSNEVYVKMPVDMATDPEEVTRAARLVAETLPDAVLYIQPLAEPDSGRWLIETAELEALAKLAAREVADTRLLPQVHKLMGIR